MGLLDRFKKKKEIKVTPNKETKTNPKISVKPKITLHTSFENNKKQNILTDRDFDKEFFDYYFNRDYDNAIKVVKEHISLYIKQNGKAPKELKERLEQTIYSKNIEIFADNNIKGRELEAEGYIDDAQKFYEKNIELNADTPFTYSSLARIYHAKKEFEKEKNIYELAIQNIKGDTLDYEKSLENVNSFLNTGKWKYDCLPSDPRTLYYDIKEAKTILKGDCDGDKEKGIEMLENIMANGTYNNTVYNTLYQIYNKDKKFDDSIRVCKKAIEVLGLFSNDRKQRWTINLEKSIKRKEKEDKITR